ncbi:glycosyltransferase family 2 protein [Candidatus Methylomirabilis sp.]|uniref:glycosyltransferase family 2 protein n=1 Tax=Candidatus Methylomirabilis sp. TaxID=2032687 RepID=UPI002A5D74FD|nr:glycosyltransferase family 2 protein [Candidatus Methylomirabilis sp.]
MHIDVNPLPLVSIITPSFNQGRFIRDTIESVLSQGYPRLEYLVMDGGSTDETVEILRSYGDRLIWRSAPDGGQADAVNTGVRLAKGEIIGWLNSDDTYQPGAIKAAVDYLIAYPEAAVVYGDAHYIDEQNTVIGTYPTEDFDLDRLAQACLICQPTAFIRRSALEAVGLLDVALHYCMDYDLWIRLGRDFRIDRINGFLANSRRYLETKSFAHREPMFQEIYTVVRRSFGRVPPHWKVCRTYYRLVDLSWPLTRWALWPARRILPKGIHHWLRKEFPVLLGRISAGHVSPGDRR